MLKQILQGMVSPQIQGMMPMGQMPQQQQQPMHPMMMDPYGQQQGGLRQALMGRFGNVRL